MKRRRLTVPIATTLLALTLSVGSANAATTGEVLTVMKSWTQPTATSYDAWNVARLSQRSWLSYGFTWSTDYCSVSPDRPLGFDFRLSCHRHDFGYRNYKAVNRFGANKARVDDAFHFDLRARCATYSAFVRPACYSLAWTYYQAVAAFGSPRITQADLDRAARLKAHGEASAAA